MNVLMLTIRMQQGYGVSEVIGAIAPELESLGVGCHVGAMFTDDAFGDLDVRLGAEPVDLQRHRPRHPPRRL